jgi:flagellar biosynthesis activator protein FlaF
MSITAYRRRQEAAEKPRELERRAFSIVIGKLAGAKEAGGRSLIDACYLNYQLWSTLQADLVLQENALPVDLKARLISLSLWVQRYTPAVMSGAASLDPLIAVNKNILEGLSVDPTPVAIAPAATIAQLGAV